MPFWPQLVGEVHIRQRKPRYAGEPVYKTLAFVRPKNTKTERWEVVRTTPRASQNFWDNPYWSQLSPEQQQYIWEQFQRNGVQPQWYSQEAPLHAIPAPPQLGIHRHHRPLLEQHHGVQVIEPEIQLIAPKTKIVKITKIDRGHDIFDSDSESSYSGSSRTTLSSSRSNKSSRSGSSSSFGGHRGGVYGW